MRPVPPWRRIVSCRGGEPAKRGLIGAVNPPMALAPLNTGPCDHHRSEDLAPESASPRAKRGDGRAQGDASIPPRSDGIPRDGYGPPGASAIGVGSTSFGVLGQPLGLHLGYRRSRSLPIEGVRCLLRFISLLLFFLRHPSVLWSVFFVVLICRSFFVVRCCC